MEVLGKLNSEAFFVFCAVFVLALGILIGFLVGKMKFHGEIKKNRRDAVDRSRSVLTGQICEQLSPYLPNFPCSPECVQFLGKPVDYVGFVSKNAELPLEERKIDEILFIEVKTGNSVLTKREREVKKAVEEGRVRYEVYKFQEKK